MGKDNESVVITTKLTKVFKDFWCRDRVTAVADLDLEILPGEVFGLLGPNGSGKSTTLKMILGLLFPTRGRISVFGKRATNVKVKQRIGFLPEETYLYPFLDARETLDFYGRLFHQPRRERRRRIDMLLEMVGLTSVAYRRIGEYSKGMQRRIGLAQGLLNDPDLLILDEPTSGMDPIGTKQFKELIRMLPQRGKTVILSSHLLADVEDVCDRVCILYGGRRRALGNTRDLLSQRSQTQITTDQLDEEALEKVRAVLSASGRELLEVTHPQEKLESLFLRIVRQAQDQRLTTSGVTATGEVPEFLRPRPAEGGEQLIEQLVGAEEPGEGSAQVSEPTEPAPPPPSKVVLGDLVTKREPADRGKPPSSDDTDPPAKRADRKVIDDLLGKDSGGDQES